MAENINPNQGLPNNDPKPHVFDLSQKSEKLEPKQTNNNSLYKANSDSQTAQSLQADTSKVNNDFDLRAKNPILVAKLEQKSNIQIINKKAKAKPPKPTVQVQAGRAINPRKVKPHIPKRLQPTYEDHVDNITKLGDALVRGEDGMKLINEYARGMLESFGVGNMRSFDSLATLFGIDESVADMDRDQLLDLFESKQEEFSDEPELKKILHNIVFQIREINLDYSNYLVPLLQLFLPIPFEFEFAEPDEEFEEDEEETKEDQSRQDGNSEDEEQFDSIASISIKTINFNKIHILIYYKESNSQLIVNINGDPTAMEIAIPIESNLDDLIGDDLNDIDYLIKIWGDNVLRVSEKRVLKVSARGKLNPIILKACNSVLETIQDSDIDLDAESDYQSGLL
ncbi:MAG: hypothetical protein O3C63_02635 [Cyanobacteria bacterium]|nr:hypothetical protein [Cyanobacteriota bacterium]MDA1020794.1 hypothetical protein [Cyanobacteriota bacterium]